VRKSDAALQREVEAVLTAHARAVEAILNRHRVAHEPGMPRP
jgi:hypothetical protein